MKTNPLKRFSLLLLPVFLLTLGSCVGISADIQIRKDGSGRIAVEYRVSRMAEVIGRLDGNERWQIVPAGRADLERTAARIPGMRLVSFSSREHENDMVSSAVLEFANTEALLRFLDPSGRRASLTRGGGSNRLTIVLAESAPAERNADLTDLMRQVSDGYKFRMSFTADGNSAVTLSRAQAAPPPAQAAGPFVNKKVSLELEMAEILNEAEGLSVSFSWNDE